MPKFIIDKIGPIEHVDFTLNKVNMLIGPQSSGKSTIAKVISFCLWLEKDVLMRRNTDYVGYYKVVLSAPDMEGLALDALDVQ